MGSIHFLVQISCFSHLKSFSHLNHIFRMLEIYVENTHNHLITSGKHSSWPPEHRLHVLLVHLVGHLVDGLFECLIDYLIASLMIVHPSAQTQMAHAVKIVQMLASFSCNRVSLSFDMIIDLFNQQIERRMLIIPLSTESQLHKYTEAIGVLV